MAFTKFETLLRKAAARTLGGLWKAVGNICDLFTPERGWSYIKAAGCVAHQVPKAVVYVVSKAPE